jgi:glycerophosphoryl diester phosphodiesterase
MVGFVMLPRPLLLGHRGVRVKSIPENTTAAFDQALADGCDGFEFDVRLRGSGRVVVCHDAKVDGIAVSAADSTQLRQLPQLQQVLSRYRQRGFLDIEIKVAGMESKVLAALREYPMERDYVVSSFLPDVVLALKSRSEIVPVGIICQKPSQLAAWRKLPVDYVIVHKSLVTRKVIQTIHLADRKIIAWTVNDEASMLRFAGWGVDAIISDKTQLLAKTLAPTLPADAPVV